MSIIQKMRQYLYRSSLQKQLNMKRDTPSKMITFENAKIIGLLFDANELKERNIVLKYATDLKKSGKKVALLGYMKNTHENEDYLFPYYNLKNIDWAKRPKGEVIDDFVQQKIDILISINLKTNSHAEYISVLSNAAFKVGAIPVCPKAYDFMLDTSKLVNLSEFINQIESVLKKTKVRPQAVLA